MTTAGGILSDFGINLLEDEIDDKMDRFGGDIQILYICSSKRLIVNKLKAKFSPPNLQKGQKWDKTM